MNDVCKTIKPSPEWLSKEFFDAIHSSAEGERPSIDLDDVMTEPHRPIGFDVERAQTADGKPAVEPDWTTALVVRDRAGYYYAPRTMPISSLRTIQIYYGPFMVIIDADGNNVEADRLRAEFSIEVAEAVRARETALRDLRKLGQEDTVLRRQIADLYRAVTRLEAENARLQAQLGDGR